MNQRTRIKRAAAVRRSRRAHVVKQQITTINRAFQKLQRKFKNINVATAFRLRVLRFANSSAPAPKHPDNPHRTTARPSA